MTVNNFDGQTVAKTAKGIGDGSESFLGHSEWREYL